MKNSTIILILLHCCLVLKANSTDLDKYKSIFCFGDSLSDTGNYIRSTGKMPLPQFPYGETFFKHPTGRYSDGRLIVDFLAEAAGLPYLKPYLEVVNGSDDDARKGVNFAVAGATALDPSFFTDRKIKTMTLTYNFLSVQLEWFKKLKSSLCKTQEDCEAYFKKSLFLVGEIGGNDYNFAFASGATFEDLRPIVPDVVGAIINATRTLIEEGAVELVVPGNLPIGCSTSYLATANLLPSTAINETTGCLTPYNEFAQYHNDHLQQELKVLRQNYSDARIIYADYYGDALRLFEKPSKYGFSVGTHSACCGAGGPLNFDFRRMCDAHSKTICDDPKSHILWDGVHLTEAAYRHMANGLINSSFTSPPLVSEKTKEDDE